MKRIKYLNKLYLTLGCGIALMSSLVSNEVYAAAYYDSISNGYYKLHGDFWWEGTAYRTEKGTLWTDNPPIPNDVYKTNAVEIGSRAALGYEVERIEWFNHSSKPTVTNRPTKWSHEKRCKVDYRRALTTPQTGTISVSNAYSVSNSLYWIKENASAHVTYSATQDFAGESKGFEDYITKNYIYFAVNGNKSNSPYITNDRWAYNISNYNNNSLLSVSFKGTNADNAKGDTNKTMHSSVYVSLKNNGTEVELGGKSDSANGTSSALSWKGIKIKCDAKNPTASISSSYTSKGANVQFSASDGESGLSSIQYKLSGAQNKDWTTISNNGSISITALGNTTVYVRATDNVGNTYETSKVVNTDTTAPTVSHTISPSGWTNGNVIINIKASDAHSGLKNITLPNGSTTTSGTVSYTVSANGKYTFKATDNAGNINTYNVNITNIDKVAPVIALSQTPTAWTNGNVTVNATITETGSGVNTRKWATGNQNASYFANGGTTITTNSFTATANGTYTFYVKDNAGNVTVKTINITNIDKVAPVIALSQTPTAWTNGNVTVTATITETGSGVNTRKWAAGNQNASYFANNGTTITTNSFVVTTNGTYTFYVKDNAGNTSVQTITISNIDKVAPVISLSQNPTAWTNGNVTVTATITETGSGVNTRKWAAGNQNASYFANNGTTITTNSFVVTTNGTYTFYVKDNAGNTSVQTITISNIDKVAPVISLSQNPTAWTNGNVTVNATITETGSGVNTRKWAAGSQSASYFANGGTTITSNSFVVTTNGTYTFYVKDNAGNTSVQTITISNIDKVAPVISLSQNPTAWTNGNVTVNATITETGSGVNTRKWAAGNQNASYFANNGTTITTNSFVVTTNGTYTFYVKDNAGNTSVQTITISNIDKVAPVISLSQNPTAWTNGNVTVNATITETGSGVNTRKWAAGNQNASYFANNGTTITTNSFVVTTNGTYTFYVKDNAGNTSVQTITISNIDKVAPVISLSQNPTAWTNGNVTVTATITETGSGVNTRKWAAGSQSASYFANGGTTITSNSFVVTTNGTYTFYVKDNAGNVTVKTITISNIDKTAPVISLSQNPTAWTNGNVTITATITETQSGVNIKKWAAGSQNASYFANNGTTITTNSFVVTTNGIYTFYVKDNVGNESTKTINITNIDKQVPTITGTLDYPWVKGTRTISFTSTDNESGINSLKLWNNNKTKVLKEGKVNNKTASLSHTITEEGITRYKIETIDIAQNITTKDVIVRIDNTAPEGIISMPNITNTKTIEVVLSNLLDTYSGLKEAIVSENATFSGSNVVKLSLSDVKSVNDVKRINFTLAIKSTIEEHFSERTVYVRLVDNVGNHKDYTFSVFLIPKNPDMPEIVTPTEDQLFVTNEIVNLSWTYNSIDEDLGYLPQHKAEIELTHIETGYTTVITVEGEVFNHELQALDSGEYAVKVKVYNFATVYKESEIRRFRFNKFKDTGNVLTIDITPGSPIRYVSIVTKADIPNGTSIVGKVYYNKKSTGAIDKTQYVNFYITNMHSSDNVIKLPIDTGNVRVEYFLKGAKGDKLISPILDHIVIYGK